MDFDAVIDDARQIVEFTKYWPPHQRRMAEDLRETAEACIAMAQKFQEIERQTNNVVSFSTK